MTAPTTCSKTDAFHPHSAQPPRRKILFASAHSILDFSNGASVATLDVLQGLTTHGFECQAFCTAKLDLATEVGFEAMIDDLHEPYQLRPSVCGADHARMLYTRRHDVPITLIRQDSTRHVRQSLDDIRTVMHFFAKFLDVYRPDVMLTYGGDPITQGMMAVAKQRAIPVVFALHNFAYKHAGHFSKIDYCIVPSEFARRHYRERIGLDCQALPNPVDWERVRVANPSPRFVTFVNPARYKGVYPFVRIAKELGRRRPDIPLLVVESRETRKTLGACGLRTEDHPNIQIMPVTTDPRRFWRLTKIVLMPSLWWESQGLVAVEAMINGIPVIGSDRGALPETLGDAGIALPLPERLTPVSQVLPTAAEVEPWVENIIRLWDDAALYGEHSARARKRAQVWHPDRLRPLYAEFFAGVRHQPGRPVLAGRNDADVGRPFLADVAVECVAYADVGQESPTYGDVGQESPTYIGAATTAPDSCTTFLTPAVFDAMCPKVETAPAPVAIGPPSVVVNFRNGPVPGEGRDPKGAALNGNRFHAGPGAVTLATGQRLPIRVSGAVFVPPVSSLPRVHTLRKGAEPAAVSFVVCVSDEAIFKANFLASPCLSHGSAHELIAIRNCPSAADGLNAGIERAKYDWVVCVHQDVVLPKSWKQCLARQLRQARRRFGPIGVAGVYGVGEVIPPPEPGGPFAAARTGWVIDRGRTLRDGPELPARVATLDELLLVVRRDAGLKFDPALGFHLYGADVCLQARERGLAVVALGALCHHNSRSVGLPDAFFASADVFARKWGHRLPVATPCAVIDHGGKVHMLGNATDGPGSMAYAPVGHGRGGDERWTGRK